MAKDPFQEIDSAASSKHEKSESKKTESKEKRSKMAETVKKFHTSAKSKGGY